jgi:hypothetical protein
VEIEVGEMKVIGGQFGVQKRKERNKSGPNEMIDFHRSVPLNFGHCHLILKT